MTPTEIIGAAVGIGGVLVAAYTVYAQQRAKKPSIKVTLGLGVRYYKETGKRSDAKLVLTAANAGDRTVVINAHALILPTKEAIVMPHTESTFTLPHKLEPEQNCVAYYDARELAPMLTKLKTYKGTIKLTGYYKDMAGRIYKSKKLEFDPTVQALDAFLEYLNSQRF